MNLLRRCCTHLWTVWLGGNCWDRGHASRRSHRALPLEAEVLEARDLMSGTGLTAQPLSDPNLHNLVLTRTDAASAVKDTSPPTASLQAHTATVSGA